MNACPNFTETITTRACRVNDSPMQSKTTTSKCADKLLLLYLHFNEQHLQLAQPGSADVKEVELVGHQL